MSYAGRSRVWLDRCGCGGDDHHRHGGSGQEGYREHVLRALIHLGYDVIHPFNAFPYDHFEGNAAIGREMALKYCCDLVDMCEGRVIVAGISEGVLLEVEHALRTHNNAQITLFPEYDPEWQNRVQQFKDDARFQNATSIIDRKPDNAIEMAT